MNAVPRVPPGYAGPALFSYGFRPFFLFGALYAAVSVLIWVPVLSGQLSISTVFVPRDCHAHELLYGYLPAVITGFLLTAIPNWTGRLPLSGAPLAALVVLWLAGRVAVASSGLVGPIIAGLVDASFLWVVAAAAGREIIAGSNWRNLKVLAPVALLAAGNTGFHVEASFSGSADVSIRVGMAAVLLLLMLIGGRVIPSFTRNWLARENPGRLPAPFAMFDAVAIALSACALVLWIVLPFGAMSAAALFTAGVLHVVRLSRWAGDRTLRDRLVLVLHVAYVFVPLGFLLVALAALEIVLPAAGVHAWMVGAAGMMTLAVMTRATLGHTGRALAASLGTQAIYAGILVAAIARVMAALKPEWNLPLLHVSALAWIAAFGGFSLLYGPMLLRHRPDAKPRAA